MVRRASVRRGQWTSRGGRCMSRNPELSEPSTLKTRKEPGLWSPDGMSTSLAGVLPAPVTPECPFPVIVIMLRVFLCWPGSLPAADSLRGKGGPSTQKTRRCGAPPPAHSVEPTGVTSFRNHCSPPSLGQVGGYPCLLLKVCRCRDPLPHPSWSLPCS